MVSSVPAHNGTKIQNRRRAPRWRPLLLFLLPILTRIWNTWGFSWAHTNSSWNVNLSHCTYHHLHVNYRRQDQLMQASLSPQLREMEVIQRCALLEHSWNSPCPVRSEIPFRLRLRCASAAHCPSTPASHPVSAPIHVFAGERKRANVHVYGNSWFKVSSLSFSLSLSLSLFSLSDFRVVHWKLSWGSSDTSRWRLSIC